MIRKTLKFSRSCIFSLLHLLMAGVLLGLALMVFVFWQFSKGPIDLTFAADYVRDAFAVEGQPVTVEFDSIVAEWPDMKGSPDINLDNFRVLESGEEKLRVGQASLQLSFLRLLLGQIAPETISLNKPVIRMVRGEDGKFTLLLSGSTPDKPSTPLPSLRQIGPGLFLGGQMPDALPVLSAFSTLKTFNIRDAELVAEDESGGVLWKVPAITVRLARTRNTIDFSANYSVPERAGLSAFNARIERSRLKKDMEYSADLRNVDLAVIANYILDIGALRGQSMILNGIVQGHLNSDWTVGSAIAAVRSDAGNIRFSSELDKAFAYKDLMVNLTYDQPSGKIALTNTSMKINDTTVSLVAERKVDAQGRRILPVTMKVPELTLAQINSLWPESQRESNAAAWITRDLSGATFRNINVTANIPEEDPNAFSGRDVDVSFDFEGLKADYRAPLIPATEARGSGTIRNDVLDILVDSGKIADLNVSEARVTITELASDVPGLATIDVALSGPLTTVFDYISRDPINLGDTIGIDPKKVAGQGDYKVNVTFPTAHDIPVDAVKVKVDATLRDTKLPGIVHGLDLTGGPLDLKVAGGAFTISGKGQLDGRPIDLVYSEYINPEGAPYVSDITARLVTDAKLRSAFGVNLDRFISGDLPADIHYKEVTKGDVTVDVKIDMTPAKAFVEPFNYVKLPGAPGEASCVAVLKGDKIQQIKNLNVTMGKDKAVGGVLTFGQVGKDWDVKSGSFSSLALGPDNQFSLKFTQPSLTQMNFVIEGDRIDARSFLEADKASPDALPVQPITSAVNVIATTRTARTGDAPDQIVNSPKIKADVDANGDIRALDIAAAVGSGPLSVLLQPDAAGRMKLKVRAADAGATLYAFDIYDDIQGGQLIVDGAQVQGGKINDIKGSATIRDFRVVDAPVLAQLMNGFSFEGMDELVKQKGISFTRLKTDYVWKESAQGRVISVSNGRTSGASIGLSFGGVINQTKGTIDVSGTFVPMSQINKFVSSIPLVGQLLTGGKNGGIIAATYAIKGQSENPSVIINPLSVLAPGFLRSILFEGGLDMDDDDDGSERAPPKKAERSGYN